jgi:bacillithiol biosynthesis deacetylase BshB1
MIDLLVFGPHPDDIEIGIGGTIVLHASRGMSVGLCDLTVGEMGSNGTPEERLAEAAAASEVLGAVWRHNLGWRDRFIGKDPAHLDEAVAFIRQHRPRTIAMPYWQDRHPDHNAASVILTEAVFNAGLRRYKSPGEPWRTDWVCYYFINDHVTPSFVTDISEYYERKQQSLACHVSQFGQERTGTVATRLNTPMFRQLIESRDAQFGALAGVRWAEGFVVREPLVRETLMKGSR